jgi:predicted ATP-dependent serine protease
MDMMVTCTFCRFETALPFVVCPACWQTQPTPDPLPETDTPRSAVTLADIPVEPVRAVRTGTGLDRLAEGVPHGAVIFLWGLEGSGKSRLALCTCAGWVETTKGRGWYVLRESMSVAQLRLYAHQHGIRPMALASILPVMVETVDPAMYRRRGPGPHLYVIDSSDDPEVVLDAKRHVSSRAGEDDTVLVIGQATKDGDFLGPRTVAHEADVTVEIQALSETERVLSITKNRMGACGVVPLPWPPARAA